MTTNTKTATSTTATSTTATAVTGPAMTALGKAITAQVKEVRSGIEPGEYNVDQTLTVRVTGKVKVGEDYRSKVVAKAEPWRLLTAAIEEIARLRNAAGMAGINLEELTRMAELVDPDQSKLAKKEADSLIAGIKEETTKVCKGRVTISNLDLEILGS
jgi:hypothetical protein